MTLIVNFVLHDSVLFVADGRMRTTASVTTDEENKLAPLSSDQVIGMFGIDDVTRPARASLSGTSIRSADAWRDELLAKTRPIHRIISALSPESLDGRIKAGLVVGGFDENGPFSVFAVDGFGLPEPMTRTMRGERGNCFFEVHGAGEAVKARLTQILGASAITPANLSAASTPEVHREFIRCAAQLIEETAVHDDGVGGTMRFQIIERGVPIRGGIVNPRAQKTIQPFSFGQGTTAPFGAITYRFHDSRKTDR